MKRQKLLTVLFCCALLIGISSVAASAQELLGTTYRLFIYPTGYPGVNADLTFQADNVLVLGIGSGVGSYYAFPPTFLGTYRALGVTFGNTTGDISMYMLGTTFSEGQSMIGLGISLFEVSEGNVPVTTFWFTGKLILTEE